MIYVKWCFYFSILISELVLGVVALFFCSFVHDSDKWLKRFYQTSIGLLILMALQQITVQIVGLYTVDVRVEHVERITMDILYMALCPLMTSYLVYCAGEKVEGSRVVRLVCVLRGLLLAEEVFFAIFDINVTGKPETAMQWGSLILSVLLSVVTFGVDIGIIAVRWKKLSGGQRVFFMCGILLLNSWVLLLIELLILREQYVRYLKQNEELVKKKNQVAILQMRPHFIYNTLITIYYLCRDDAAKAQKVVLDFSRYLQANFTAIASEENIPFAKELEHTKAYLAVEKVRYEDKLYVEYDTPAMMFNLPALTLQPIVENAVKYGISPELAPLYITIRTEETDRDIRIIVEDTGPGYHPPDNEEPHFALENISERLEMMCGGTLEITDRKAGGTKVTIQIPTHGKFGTGTTGNS